MAYLIGDLIDIESDFNGNRGENTSMNGATFLPS